MGSPENAILGQAEVGEVAAHVRPDRETRGDAAVEEAVKLTFSPSVLKSAKIESFRADSALVIDINGWLVSDLSDISQRVKRAVSETPSKPGAASFAKDLSYLESVKAFPKNLNAVARLTFKPGKPVSISSVPDSRFISVAIHYTMAELPADLMRSRLADDRVGTFLTVQKDFAQDDKTFFRRYVNKWRLEPAPGARPDADGLVEPVKPIIYYIDNTVPEEYRPYLKAGVEEWNRAYEAAGFKNAIRAEPLPDWWKEMTDHYTQSMIELYRSHGAARPASQKILFYYAKRGEYVLDYLGCIQALRESAIARKKGDNEKAVEEMEKAVESMYNCMDTLSDVIRDPSDRGLIAVLNAHAYRPLVAEYEKLLDATEEK